ncbi:DNA alkylation repair protein [Ichthyenterobacterium sp. W332]|uniref:DNA alkylation repair protein n=1 Tax=Microcosmobacter mediterraneus TaxID=3075607 RepID=A0ABU2YH40_9FLAO|nr:DNA alkylation repair protein [Ichthyenterobacterium sp. W332]MDT0557483.1 DNA alkylation repair protein [Ichthyenterobacterium sp. W332]
MNFITELTNRLESERHAEFALQMHEYMKRQFPFLGVKSPLRKQLLKEVLANHKEDVIKNVRNIAETLYAKSEREYHYCAIEILAKILSKKYKEEDLEYITALIYTNSHWDTVDFIAKHILGSYLLQFWENKQEVITKISQSDNMWLNRSAILFQLGYKERTDETILFEQCLAHKHSKEFFIQKAIGWALREYSKTNPDAVLNFVETNKLKPLSAREALKRIQ